MSSTMIELIETAFLATLLFLSDLKNISNLMLFYITCKYKLDEQNYLKVYL